MSDSIQPVRFIPPVHRLNPKGKTGDREGDKEGKQDFSDYLTGKDEDVKGKDSNQENEQHKDSGQHKQEDKGSLQTKKDNDVDGACGTILDTEV